MFCEQQKTVCFVPPKDARKSPPRHTVVLRYSWSAHTKCVIKVVAVYSPCLRKGIPLLKFYHGSFK